MDLTSINIASAIQQSQTYNSVQASVAGLTLDAQREEGIAAVAMIRAAEAIGASHPAFAAATGLGGRLDVRA